MNRKDRKSIGTWDSAFLALSLLLCSASAGAAGIGIQRSELAEKPHLDGGARWLNAPAASLDSVPQSLGLPVTGAQFVLWGGGATLVRPELRLQASAWTGSLSAVQGSNSSAWDLQLGELLMEQKYEKGAVLLTGGASANYAQLRGQLSGPGGHSSIYAPLWGGGLNAGVRWPRATPMGFFVRAGYIWMTGIGDWRGDQAALLKSTTFDLGGPHVTGQVELAF